MKPSNSQPAPRLRHIILNVVAYQLSWWLLVEQTHVRLAYACVVLSVMGYAVYRPKRLSSWLVLPLITLLGVTCDSLLAYWGIYGPVWQAQGIPLWLIALWLVFATLFPVSLAWLENRLFLGAILGAIGGPSSYWLGSQLGQITVFSWLDLLILTGVWLLLTPMLLGLTHWVQRFDSLIDKQE